MSETLQAFLSNSGVVLGYVTIVLLCLGGLVLCCLTISGNWLVLLAAITYMAYNQYPADTISVLTALALLSCLYAVGKERRLRKQQVELSKELSDQRDCPSGRLGNSHRRSGPEQAGSREPADKAACDGCN